MTNPGSDPRGNSPYKSGNKKRHSQIFCQHDLWYFRTLEGDEVGPFRYRSEAQTGLEVFLSQRQGSGR